MAEVPALRSYLIVSHEFTIRIALAAEDNLNRNVKL